jgi:hypothetical protein
MAMVLGLLIYLVFNWIVLMVVVVIAQRLADFPLPPWVELAWKLAAILAVTILASFLLDRVSPILGWLASAVIFWVGLWKVLELDMFGVVVIWVLNMVLRWILGGILIAALS